MGPLVMLRDREARYRLRTSGQKGPRIRVVGRTTVN